MNSWLRSGRGGEGGEEEEKKEERRRGKEERGGRVGTNTTTPFTMKKREEEERQKLTARGSSSRPPSSAPPPAPLYDLLCFIADSPAGCCYHRVYLRLEGEEGRGVTVGVSASVGRGGPVAKDSLWMEEETS